MGHVTAIEWTDHTFNPWIDAMLKEIPISDDAWLRDPAGWDESMRRSVRKLLRLHERRIRARLEKPQPGEAACATCGRVTP